MTPLANAQRLDPYKNFKFRLNYDGRHVYGGNQVTGFTPASVAAYRSGGDPGDIRRRGTLDKVV